jgi:hypothetical protein
LGTYALLAYSVGFSFNSTYEEDFELVGAATYPKLTVRGQTATEFIADPTLVRMRSTDPANRDRGNYVMFENVSPAADGTLLLTVTPQSTTVGNAAYFPPINALQLVRMGGGTTAPALGIRNQGGDLRVTWGADATGYLLQSSPTIGSTANWTAVTGLANPITGAGSVPIFTPGSAEFFRLRRQ